MSKIFTYACAGAVAMAVLSSNGGIAQFSPFVPYKEPIPLAKPPAPKPSVDPQKQQFELKGFIVLNDDYKFSIYDKKSKKSLWLSLGENINGFTIVGFDPLSETITYDYKGRSYDTLIVTQTKSYNLPLAGGQQNGSTPSGVRIQDANTANVDLSAGASNRGQVNTSDYSATINNSTRTTNTSESPHSNRSTQNFLYRGTTAFASNTPSGTGNNQIENTTGSGASNTTDKKYVPLKIRRRNKVHNPSGKLPQILR